MFRRWRYRRFMKLGTKLFNVFVEHAPDGELLTVMFANTPRDLNITIRTYVEWLDERGYSSEPTEGSLG
jgi:hypothetical protein